MSPTLPVPVSPSNESADYYDDELSGDERETGKRPIEMESTLPQKKIQKNGSDSSDYIVQYNTYLSGTGRLGPTLEEEELLENSFCCDADDDDDSYLGWTLMYDKHTPDSQLHFLLRSQRLSKLAIESYNQENNTQYHFVDVVRAIGHVVSGFNSHLKFTANQNGADAITFTAQVYEPLQKQAIVESVTIVAEGAILPVDTLPITCT